MIQAITIMDVKLVFFLQAITLAEHDINDVDCELKLDFRVLVPNQV